MLRRKTKEKKQPEKVLGYEELLEQQFQNRNGRLFVVDMVKSRVLRALRGILARQNIREALFVVKDPRIAGEYAKSLYPNEDVQIIGEMKSMRVCLEQCGLGAASLTSSALNDLAEEFKKRFPKLIICFENGEEAVLHGALCPKKGVEGAFSAEEVPDYCVSDFLAACGYEFTLFDDIYGMFAFSPTETEDWNNLPSPVRFERVVFRGKAYYTDARHSYARLLRMADGCERCVILSDVLAKQDLLSVYLTLSMIQISFPYRKAKAFVRDHAANYLDECENVYGGLSLCYRNPSILSRCLQKLPDVPQYTPDSINALSTYIGTQFHYFSQEELFLRAVYSQAYRLYNGEYAGNYVIIRRLEQFETVADTFCDVFFSDQMKGVFENPECAPVHDRISDMDKEEFRVLRKIVEQHGGYIPEAPPTRSFKVARVYHEESGFEEVLRYLIGKDFDRQTNVYATARYAAESSYRGISLKCLVEAEGLETPVLVLTRDSGQALCENLNELLPGVACTADPMELVDAPDGDVTFAVTDYSHFRSMAVELPVKTVVFCDLLHDISLMDRLIKKAQSLRSEGVTVRALTDHRGVGSYIANAWEQILSDPERKIVPVDLFRVVYDDRSYVAFEELIGRLDLLHRAMGDLMEDRYEENLTWVSQEIRNLMVDYTKKASSSLEEIRSDLIMFSELAKSYNRLFANSVSIGRGGTRAYSMHPTGRTPSGKTRKNLELRRQELFETVEENPRLVFNCCVRQLFGQCDETARNCASCERYPLLKVNDFESFSAGAELFFEKASKFLNKKVERRKKEESEVIIRAGVQSDDGLKEKLNTVLSYTQMCKATLKSLRDESRETLFFTEYKQIEEIRNMASQTLAMFFKPYHELLLSVFDQITNQMKKALETSEWVSSEKNSETVDRRK